MTTATKTRNKFARRGELSDAIRTVIAELGPEATPAKVSTELDERGVKASRPMVATLVKKSREQRQARLVDRNGDPVRERIDLGALMAAKTTIRRLGSAAAAHQAIDAVDKLLA